ncbi:MAG: hypothetical protein RIQ47_1106 [Bacteroidota bacterium]|jgi:hypothetical protein
MRIVFLLLFIGFLLPGAKAQDTIVFINGKQVAAQSVQVSDYSVDYRTVYGKLKHADAYRIFSVRKAEGQEQIVYRPDPNDSIDFSIEQMRLFIKGEQDAEKYFRGHGNKVVSFGFGFASSLMGWFGLAGPPIYSTVIGSFSPNMEKARVSDEAYRSVPEYCEGYQRKSRDKKIRNSFLSGMAGFAAGIIVLSTLVK